MKDEDHLRPKKTSFFFRDFCVFGNLHRDYKIEWARDKCTDDAEADLALLHDGEYIKKKERISSVSHNIRKALPVTLGELQARLQ
jgi:hypothetical protein